MIHVHGIGLMWRTRVELKRVRQRTRFAQTLKHVQTSLLLQLRYLLQSGDLKVCLYLSVSTQIHLKIHMNF